MERFLKLGIALGKGKGVLGGFSDVGRPTVTMHELYISSVTWAACREGCICTRLIVNPKLKRRNRP